MGDRPQKQAPFQLRLVRGCPAGSRPRQAGGVHPNNGQREGLRTPCWDKSDYGGEVNQSESERARHVTHTIVFNRGIASLLRTRTIDDTTTEPLTGTVNRHTSIRFWTNEEMAKSRQRKCARNS